MVRALSEQVWSFRMQGVFAVVTTLLWLAAADQAAAQCTDEDDQLAVANGTLADGDPFDTLFKLLACDASGGASGANPPFEFIDPTVATNGYALGAPVASHALSYRFVPLCSDGSGDHLYTVAGAGSGQGLAPTCPSAEWIRCGDGTRPLYYADKAVSTAGGPPIDIESDDWLFYVQGGASCGTEVHRGDEFDPARNLDIDQGEMCFVQGQVNGGQLTSDGEQRSRDLDGIMQPHATNALRGFNRVTIDRCTQDLWLGDRDPLATWDNSDNAGLPVAGATSYTLFRHGHRLFKAVLTDLAQGAEFADNGGAGAFQLPSISAADTVLLTANSNGAFGLIHSMDKLEDFLSTNLSVDVEARIRAVLDNRLEPSLENEAAFNNPPILCMGTACTLYDGIESGTSANPIINSYSELQYRPHTTAGANDGHEYEFLNSWGDTNGAVLDASCLTTHTATGDAWRCNDFVHVLANHVATPFFVHQALSDSALQVHSIDWAADPLQDSWDLATYQSRMVHQLETLLDLHSIAGDEGLSNADWSMAVFAPNSTHHVALTDSAEFSEVCLQDGSTNEQSTYQSALLDWLVNDDPQGGGARAIGLIEGSATHPASRCDGAIFHDGFESGDTTAWQ